MPPSGFIHPIPLKRAKSAHAINPRRQSRTPLPAVASANNGASTGSSLNDASAASSGADSAQVPFSIIKTVMPHDSDYSKSLWHGAYIRYFEEARIRYLDYKKLNYGTLVHDYNTEFVTRELTVKYMRPVRLGDNVQITVKRVVTRSKMTLVLESEFLVDGVLCATARATHVPVQADSGKLRRKLPDIVEEATKGEESEMVITDKN